MTPTERLRAIHELAVDLAGSNDVDLSGAKALAEIVRLSEAPAEAEASGWIRCDERMPANARTVIGQTDEGFIYLVAWVTDHWDGDGLESQEVIVEWHELPRPYSLPKMEGF